MPKHLGQRCRAAREALSNTQTVGTWSESWLNVKTNNTFAEATCPMCEGSRWLIKPYVSCPLCRGFGVVSATMRQSYMDALRPPKRKSTQHDPRKNFHVAGKVSGRRYKCVITDGS